MHVKILSCTTDPVFNINMSARRCYNSRDKYEQTKGIAFIKGLIRSGHLTPLESASVVFDIDDISRSCLAQLTRHRIGVSFCVESQRYVDQTKNGYVLPPSVAANDQVRSVYENAMEAAKAAYKELLLLGVKKEDARMVLPEGTFTRLTMTVNFRELRHIFELRMAKDAQWEIQQLCRLMADELDSRSLRWVYEDIENKL